MDALIEPFNISVPLDSLIEISICGESILKMASNKDVLKKHKTYRGGSEDKVVS